MKKRLFATAGVIIAAWLALFAYVSVAAGRQLLDARATLSQPPQDLDANAIGSAQRHLQRAEATLDSWLGRVARLIPVLGSNLDALDAVASASLPVLDAASALEAAARSLETDGILEDGQIRLDLIHSMIPALQRQIAAVEDLEQELKDRRKGGLLPPIWDGLDSLLDRARYLHHTAGDLTRLLQLSDGMLGGDGKRTYLVLLLNNAELRGAGGLLSGVGTLNVDEGRVTLGRLYTAEQLLTHPLRRVKAPADFERRYALYKANTTLWKNATYSSDFPEVAVVAARLFETVKGVETDGVLQLDPRALSSLMPVGSEIDIPVSGDVVSSEELPEYVYSTAYERFSDPRERRAAILQAGGGAFEMILSEGLRDQEALSRAGSAIAGGHLAFVSFDPDEASALDAVGVSGNLSVVPSDSLLVASQNFGGGRGAGSKLDYWTERRIRHACSIEADGGSATCATEVTLRNEVPDGLSRYVAGYPYGLLRSFVEIYVPENAEVPSVSQDGRAVQVRPGIEDGRTSLDVYAEVPQGATAAIRVDYLLPLSDRRYSFVATPQPLARDAYMEFTLRVPADWTIRTPDGRYDSEWRLTGAFDRTVEVEAMPDARTGIPALWERFTDFLEEPLF